MSQFPLLSTIKDCDNKKIEIQKKIDSLLRGHKNEHAKLMAEGQMISAYKKQRKHIEQNPPPPPPPRHIRHIPSPDRSSSSHSDPALSSSVKSEVCTFFVRIVSLHFF